MIVNKSNLFALERNFRTTLAEAYKEGPTEDVMSRLTTPISSNAGVEEYDWLADLSGVQELLGTPEIDNLVLVNWLVENKEFHKTISVKRKDIERDQIGVYNTRLQKMAGVFNRHPGQLLGNTLVDGFTKKDYTGKRFFDVQKKHQPKGKVEFSNRTDGALSHDAFDVGVESLMSIKGEDGNSLNLGTDLVLICGPANRSAALKILKTRTIDGGDSNTNYEAAELIIWPQIATTSKPNAWFLADYGSELTPFVHQEELPLEFAMATNPNDTEVIKTKAFLAQAYARYNISYLFPQAIYGSTGEGE